MLLLPCARFARYRWPLQMLLLHREEDDFTARFMMRQVIEGNHDSLSRVELRTVSAKLHDDERFLLVAPKMTKSTGNSRDAVIA